MKLPPYFNRKNLSIAALFFLPLPFLLILFNFFGELQNQQILRARIQILEEKTAQVADRKQKNEKVLAQLRKSEPQFLEKNLESLSFASLAENGGENRLAFQEEQPRRAEQIEEVEIKQKSPVLVSEDELKKILSLLEAKTIGSNTPDPSSPQILVKDLKLAKKMNEQDDELYEVMLELIKREPLRNP